MTNANNEILTPINIILAVAIVLLMMDMCKTKTEKFEADNQPKPAPQAIEPEEEEEEPAKQVIETTGTPTEGQAPGPYMGDSEFGPVGSTEKMHMPNCPGGESWGVSANLLPKDDPNFDDSFTEFSLKNENYLDSTNFQIGMQSQTLRNANLQLRSDPPIEQNQVCAWMNTTIDPETRRDFLLGSQPVEVQ